MFLWRNKKNYPRIINKYPSLTIPMLNSTHNIFSWAQLFKTNDVVSQCIVNTLIIKYGMYGNIFAKKNVSSYSHFFSKNTSELDTVLTRTVNIFTTNELVKLMML